MARPLPPGDEPGDFSFLNADLNSDNPPGAGFDFAAQAADLAAFDASGFPGFPSEESPVTEPAHVENSFSESQVDEDSPDSISFAEVAGDMAGSHGAAIGEKVPEETAPDYCEADAFVGAENQSQELLVQDAAVESSPPDGHDDEAGGMEGDTAEDGFIEESPAAEAWEGQSWAPSDDGVSETQQAITQQAITVSSEQENESPSEPDDAAAAAAAFAAIAVQAVAADAAAGTLPKVQITSPTPSAPSGKSVVNPVVNPVVDQARASSRSAKEEKPTTSAKPATASAKPTGRDAAKSSGSKGAQSDPSTAASAAAARPSSPGTAATSAGKTSPALLGYAIALTLLFILLVVTGRVSLFGHHALESLPDLRPLAPNEFRRVPDGTPVPENHVLQLGESRRFGDVVLTPLRVTVEPLKFQGFLTGEPEETLTTTPVLKLWLKFENQSGSYGFPPWDAGLMSSRTPPISSDESTLANSFLNVIPKPNTSPVRVLNYLQTMDSNFVITGQQSAKVIMPDESFETFIASSEDISTVGTSAESEYTWRIQFRKGVNESSGNGVTTLVEVRFSGNDVVKTPQSEPQVKVLRQRPELGGVVVAL